MLTGARKGFTLVEMLVGLVIIAVLAAVLLPSLASRIRVSSSAVLANNLQAVNAGALSYRENVGKYPHELLELTTKPTAGTSQDACGGTLSTTSVALWQGPYISQTVTSSGLQSGDGVIANTIARSPSNTSLSTVMDGLLQLSVSEVTLKSANYVDSLFEAGTGLAAGSVQWTATTTSMGTLTYAIPIRGC
jgi:prepilin-type N-terminal cleavage/methylation domain-containing protein